MGALRQAGNVTGLFWRIDEPLTSPVSLLFQATHAGSIVLRQDLAI